MALKAIEADQKASQLTVYNVSCTFGSVDSDPSTWHTADGQAVWHDGVHLTAEAYLALGMAILATGEEESSTGKRSRLESVVPGSAAPHQSRRGAVPLPAWVSGQTSRRGRGRGGGGGAQGWLSTIRGRGFSRGGSRPPYRGARGGYGGGMRGRGRGY